MKYFIFIGLLLFLFSCQKNSDINSQEEEVLSTEVVSKVINGRVIDQTRSKPLYGGKVTLFFKGIALDSVITDHSGNFKFQEQEIPINNAFLVFSKQDYVTNSVRVDYDKDSEDDIFINSIMQIGSTKFQLPEIDSLVKVSGKYVTTNFEVNTSDLVIYTTTLGGDITGYSKVSDDGSFDLPARARLSKAPSTHQAKTRMLAQGLSLPDAPIGTSSVHPSASALPTI